MSSCHCDARAERAQEQKRSQPSDVRALTQAKVRAGSCARALRTRAVHGFPSVSLRRDDRAAAAGWAHRWKWWLKKKGGPEDDTIQIFIEKYNNQFEDDNPTCTAAVV